MMMELCASGVRLPSIEVVDTDGEMGSNCGIMSSLSRQQLDWFTLLCVNATVPAMLAWKTYSGDITVKVAMMTAIIILPIMNSVVVIGVRSRRKRQSIETPRSFILGAVGMAVVSAVVPPLTVASIPARNSCLAFPDTELNHTQGNAVVARSSTAPGTPAASVNTLEISEENASLLENIGGYPDLEVLSITCVEDLQSIPDSIGKLTHLKELNIDNGNGCSMNPILPETIGNLSSLEKLVLYGAQDPPQPRPAAGKAPQVPPQHWG
jgi:hypothetical protein